MKISVFVVFFSVVLTIYSLINFYIYRHGLYALPSEGKVRMVYSIVFGVLFIAYIAGRFMERAQWFNLASVFTFTGSFWLAAIFYFFLLVLIFDVFQLLNAGLHFLPAFLFADFAKTKLILFLSACIISFSLITAGFINASSPRIKKLDINLNKKAGELSSLNIVMVSDIHIGTLIGYRKVEKLVNHINRLKPDMVLFAGDVIDEELSVVLHYNMGAPLKKLNAPLGVYAITGNHEYIGGAEAAVRYLESLNIKMLRDTCVTVSGAFNLAGREDRDISRFSGKKRKNLEEIIKDADTALPLILLDHQPFRLDLTEKCGVDIQLSGHTHHGQIFPLNFLTRKIYENSWGYLKKGNSHIYVSCGYGTWGPPIRLGNRPEIVQLRVKFKG
ncbi:MAG: metallophosphoesterase [Lentimicrobiaceae bacterium]|nr:metallophosphoesterase [Lentimicrobiaceae bacterium]